MIHHRLIDFPKGSLLDTTLELDISQRRKTILHIIATKLVNYYLRIEEVILLIFLSSLILNRSMALNVMASKSVKFLSCSTITLGEK